MDKEKILAGIDVGHVNTKAIIIRGREILGYYTVPTGFDVVAAAQTGINHALDNAGIRCSELDGIAATGIFRDIIKVPPLNVIRFVPEYVADAKGALFLDKNSRTVIDIGANIHKAVHYDQDGNLLDVFNNDKCADGLGIFYTTVARTIGLSEPEMSALALKSTKNVSIAIQCVVSAESDTIDLLCQGIDVADLANAILKFIAERVAAMSTYRPLAEKVVVSGGLARSKALVEHLSSLIKQDVSILELPEYVGSIGAAVSCNDVK